VDRNTPDAKLWRLTPPRAGTFEPLIVDFPKPMDYALLGRLIEVPGVAGSVTLDREETQWRFTPREPWKAGAHTLTADNSLEDISGNRLDRPFDVDLRSPGRGVPGAKAVSLAFTIR
jgi:hypothetical protein